MISALPTLQLAPIKRTIRTGGTLGAAVLACLVLLCCGPNAKSRRPPIGTAFIGPITVHIRQEINLKSAEVATLAHGDKVDIVEIKRIFALVRTGDGHEGWIEARQLMTSEQMNELRAQAERALKLPSQGVATSYEPVNVHAAPDRNSPSFFQIREGGHVDVLAHRVEPRLPRSSVTPQRLLPPRPKKGAHKEDQGDETETHRPFRPPRPPAPGLPANWRELSKTDKPEDPAPPPVELPPVPTDDWTLVRTPEGAAGWALTRMLVMAIPDEVAQYSEGHRIAAYFVMGDVRDGDRVKHDWLWTTQSQSNVPYDFDSFRYFVYNPRHHQYETGYIQRNVVGYFPVTVTPGAHPKFSVILQDDDGKLYRNHFVLQGYHVHRESREPWTPPVENAEEPPPAPPAEQTAKKPGLVQRIQDKIHGWFK